jgi:TPR repeat protein
MTPAAAVNAPVLRTRKALLLSLFFTGIFLALGLVYPGRSNPRLAWTFYTITALLLCWQCALFFRAGGKSRGFAWEYVPVRSHYVQASVQFAIYVYWGWYWRNVYTEFPLILAQVAFLYAVDGLLTWSRGQTWRLGFGPWPIIFSTNLFMWFRDDWFWLQFLMVATGVVGKQFVRWKRDGKITHIFNPSAFGLTIFSLILIFTGTTDHTWGREIAVTQGLPPHIYMEMFLCGMVVQYFFYVTLLTFSAAGMLALLSLAYTHITGVYLFVDSNIPIAVFLGLHLLMTDPATTPRSSIGRITFGSLYGVGVFLAYIILNDLHLPEFYDKLIIVPFLNLLAPLLDRLASFGLAGKYTRWEAKVSPFKVNLAFMGCWIAVFAAMLATGFVEAPHPGATIAFWEKAAEENRPRAVGNLRYLLAQFDQANLEDQSKLVGSVGGPAGQNRGQLLGILCNQVATIYAQGKLVPLDSAKAVRYFEKSCELGNLEGCANLALLHDTSTNSGSAGDVAHALSVLEESCAHDPNGRICYLVGQSYDNGRDRPVDKARARQFYEQGAALGDLASCKSAARMSLTGEGGPADHAAAARWLQKAADQQDGASCLYLARLYHQGDGVPKDELRANALLEQACKLGVQPACDILKQSGH